MFSAASVCLFVCQHDNFRMSKHRMLKHGAVGAKILAEFKFGGHRPPVTTHPKNVALGYDVGKISAGCLVSTLETCDNCAI